MSHGANIGLCWIKMSDNDSKMKVLISHDREKGYVTSSQLDQN